jgi:hypothetical protein
VGLEWSSQEAFPSSANIRDAAGAWVQVDAGKVELEGAQYLGFALPFDLRTLCIIEALLMGYIEVQRNSTLDPEDRCYPGGNFDPLGALPHPPTHRPLTLSEDGSPPPPLSSAVGLTAAAFACSWPGEPLTLPRGGWAVAAERVPGASTSVRDNL